MVRILRKAGLEEFVANRALRLLIASFILGVPLGAATQAKPFPQKTEDPTVHLVKFLLQQPSAGVADGRLEGAVERLGDRVGTALLQIFTAKELRDAENIRRFLPIIRNAFQYPKLIPAAYRKPRVTLPFLARLERQAADATLREEISAVAEFVKQQTRPKP